MKSFLMIVICFMFPGLLNAQAAMNDLRAFKNKTGKWGFKDERGMVVIEPAYDQAFDFSEGLGRVINRQPGGELLTGFINSSGTLVIPMKYNLAGNFSESLAKVGLGKYPDTKYGYIDKTGKEVITLQYTSAQEFSEGLAGVTNKDKKLGYINKLGKTIIPFAYEDGMPFSLGMAAVAIRKNGGMGLIDKKGKMIVQPKYALVFPFNEGMAIVMTGELGDDSKFGFIDSTGKETIPLKYALAKGFHEGLAAVSMTGSLTSSKDKRYCYIDRSGKEVIPASFTDAGEFSDGLARVTYPDNKQYFIDRAGKKFMEIKLPYTYYVENYKNGKALVTNYMGDEYYVDKTGKRLPTPVKPPGPAGPEPYESNFQRKIDTAASSEARGRILNEFSAAIIGLTLSEEEKINMVLAKYKQMMSIDFQGVWQALLNIEETHFKFVQGKVRILLSQPQQDAIKAMGKYHIDKFNAKQNKQPAPPWPANVPKEGQPWK